MNTSAHNFSAVKMSGFSLKNIPIYPSKVYKISSLRKKKKRVNLLSVLNQIKENIKTHTRGKKQRREETMRGIQLLLTAYVKERICSQENWDCLWLQYRFYIAPRKRELCLKLQRCLGELSAVGVILALWLVWLFRCRGHEETEGSKMHLSRDG